MSFVIIIHLDLVPFTNLKNKNLETVNVEFDITGITLYWTIHITYNERRDFLLGIYKRHFQKAFQ